MIVTFIFGVLPLIVLFLSIAVVIDDLLDINEADDKRIIKTLLAAIYVFYFTLILLYHPFNVGAFIGVLGLTFITVVVLYKI